MKNKLTDLNDHLFPQLERLGDEELSSEQLTAEIERSRSIATISREIITNGRLLLDAQKEFGDGTGAGRGLLGLDNKS